MGDFIIDASNNLLFVELNTYTFIHANVSHIIYQLDNHICCYESNKIQYYYDSKCKNSMKIHMCIKEYSAIYKQIPRILQTNTGIVCVFIVNDMHYILFPNTGLLIHTLIMASKFTVVHVANNTITCVSNTRPRIYSLKYDKNYKFKTMYSDNTLYGKLLYMSGSVFLHNGNSIYKYSGMLLIKIMEVTDVIEYGCGFIILDSNNTPHINLTRIDKHLLAKIIIT